MFHKSLQQTAEISSGAYFIEYIQFKSNDSIFVYGLNNNQRTEYWLLFLMCYVMCLFLHTYPHMHPNGSWPNI